jgi:hypothetical protein
MQRSLTSVSVALSVAGLVVASGLLAIPGCSKPHERLNSPPQGHTEYRNQLQEPYVYMADNAMLADMSMSPVHFVPHQTELNSLGARRLKRYAEILKIYGGTLRYDGTEDAKKLSEGRLAQIKHFLLAEGLDADRVEVQTGLAGGDGMNASEAILVRQETNFKPGETSSGSSSSCGSSSAMQASGTTAK